MMENKQDEIIMNENSDVTTPVELSMDDLKQVCGGKWNYQSLIWLTTKWNKLAAQQYNGERKLREVLAWGNRFPQEQSHNSLLCVLRENGFDPSKV